MDAKRASASFKADEDMIKNHIEKMHKSFKYVNETVEMRSTVKFSDTWKAPLRASTRIEP